MNIQRRPRMLLWAAGMTAFWGAIAFGSVASSSSFETLRIVDIIRLMTAGAGLALCILFLCLFFTCNAGSQG